MKQSDALPPGRWSTGQLIVIISSVIAMGVGVGAIQYWSTWGIRDDVFSKSGQENAVPVARTGAAVGDPVHIEVVDVGIKGGDAVLTLNREISEDWRGTFIEVVDTKDFHGLAPDGWTHKRERSISIIAFDVVGDAIRVNDVPAEPASLRQLMRAVRDAMEKTNAAKPSADPRRADGSLNGVLEEVFGKGSGEPARVPPGVGNGRQWQAMKGNERQ